jgi:hypothetical protein
MKEFLILTMERIKKNILQELNNEDLTQEEIDQLLDSLRVN